MFNGPAWKLQTACFGERSRERQRRRKEKRCGCAHDEHTEHTQLHVAERSLGRGATARRLAGSPLSLMLHLSCGRMNSWVVREKAGGGGRVAGRGRIIVRRRTWWWWEQNRHGKRTQRAQQCANGVGCAACSLLAAIWTGPCCEPQVVYIRAAETRPGSERAKATRGWRA